MNDITYKDNAPKNRNTIDYYKRWETEAIRADLDHNRVNMVNICMNLTSDFNKSSIVRANNAFLGSEVWIVGKRKFDRRGTVGTHHYEHMKYAPEFIEVHELLKDRGYTFFAVDNTPEYCPQAIFDAVLPEKSAFVYGEEQLGLSEDVVALCEASVYIPQYGSVRSINVAQAAAVCMYEYSRQHRQ